MTRRILTIALAVAVNVLMLVGTAQARTAVSQEPYQQWINSSLVPTPTMLVNVVTGIPASSPEWPCGSPRIAGCMLPGTVWIASDFIEKADPYAVHLVFMHEIGHQFDWAYMTESSRSRFTRLMEYTGPWWGAGVGKDPLSPGERFADAFDECAMSRRKNHSANPAERAPCALIRHVAKDPHYAPLPRYPEGIVG